ncbi:AAA family ATPase [Streptomyces sp. NPDC058001]|uniref:AAA family ATPase n=1 Tax=Streptomyces sp. NPDC058001 TaxID=3346300 RepID=UPI0036E83D82
MAAGKSTVAQALAERLPRAAHVRGDVFRRMIVSGRHEYAPGTEDPEARAQLSLRHGLSAATADTYARAGFTAIVQDVVLGEDLGRYPGLVRTRPLHVVVLAPDAETVAVRESGRAKTGYGAWTVAELDRALREGTPRIGLWLDSSGLDVDGTVDAVLGRWAEARVA